MALNFLGKIFETVTKVQLDPFPVLVPIENCSFHPPKIYVEYLDIDKMRRSVIKYICNILKHIK